MAYTRFPSADGTGTRERGRGRRGGQAVPPETAIPEPVARSGRIRAGKAESSEKLSALIVVFIIAVFTPAYFNLGSMALTPARVVMVLICIPVMLKFFGSIRWRVSDVMMMGFTIWMALALLDYGGIAKFQFIGITAVETLTPYFLARTMIRNQGQYNAFLRFMVPVIAVMLVHSAIQATTQIMVINDILKPFVHVYGPVPDSYEKRLGMMRAQGTFEHPILYGVLMALFYAPFFFLPRKDGQGISGIRRAAIAAGACFFSLSTGGWLGLVVQNGLMAWNWVLRNFAGRWKLLMALVVLAYIFVDMVSNRNPFQVFITYLTLNSETSYWRVLIFIYGMQNVWAHPFFGIGLGDWVRPYWMYSSSVDNFWLLNTMRYGIPGFVFIAGLFLSVILQLARARIASDEIRAQRNAFLYTMVGCCLALCTVHIWGTTLYLVMFLLGSCSWMWELEGTADAATATGDGRGVRARRR